MGSKDNCPRYRGTGRWRTLGIEGLLASAALLLLSAPLTARAAEFGDFKYHSSGAQITVTGYTGAGLDVTIPDTIDGLPVTSIGGWAFWRCTRLTSVTIPNSVTSIGVAAFSGCTSLTRAYFEGRPPEIAWGELGFIPALIVFYRPGTPGWDLTYDGQPTAMWTEPPVYSVWLTSSGLLPRYPDASAEANDPDQDGLTNYAEMLAGTDPTDRTSLLILETAPRPNDLTAEDQTPIGATQRAVYFRSAPHKSYGVQWAESLNGPWHTTAVVTTSTTQKRLVLDRPATHAFYRVILAQ